MKILRIGLGVLVAAYGLFCLFPIGANVLFKLGRMPAPTGEAARMVPLWEATSWPMLAVWTLAILLILAAAWRLIFDRAALAAYLAGAVLDVAGWWFMQRMPAYRQVFTPAELQMDYYMFAFMAVVAVLIWWVEGRPGVRAATA